MESRETGLERGRKSQTEQGTVGYVEDSGPYSKSKGNKRGASERTAELQEGAVEQ